MLSVRYDEFEVEHAPASARGSEDGDAWVVAYSLDRGKRWRFMVEWLRVRSDVSARPVLLSQPALATETKIELSLRHSISGTLPRSSPAQ